MYRIIKNQHLLKTLHCNTKLKINFPSKNNK